MRVVETGKFTLACTLCCACAERFSLVGNILEVKFSEAEAVSEISENLIPSENYPLYGTSRVYLDLLVYITCASTRLVPSVCFRKSRGAVSLLIQCLVVCM